MNHTEILNTIDSITDIESMVLESVIDVYSALSNEYEKALTIMEYYEGNDTSAFSIFQEGEILDKATGKNTTDSAIKKIILFIPRLIGAIISAIAGVFTNKNKKETMSSLDNAQYTISNSNDEYLTKLAGATSQVSNGEVKFDKKTGKFSFGKKFKHIKNRLIMAAAFTAMFKKIRTACKSENIPYKKLADDLKAIFKGDKDADAETVAYSLSSIKEMISDSFVVSLGLKASCEELGTMIEDRMRKDFADGKNTEKLQHAKALVDNIHGVSSVVVDITAFNSLMRKVFSLFGRKAAHDVQYAEKYDELKDLKLQNKNLKNIMKEQRAEAKLEKKLHKAKKRNTTLRDMNKETVKQQDDSLQSQRDKQFDEDLEYETTGKYNKVW